MAKAEITPRVQENARESIYAPLKVGSDIALVDADVSNILVHAKSSWYLGDWNGLAAIDATLLKQHPDRATLAVLIASAQQQLGQHDAAMQNIRLALQWGCSSRLVAEILIAGIHNTLGRAAALRGDKMQTRLHFLAAVAPGAKQNDGKLLGHARSIREIARIGLLPDAAALLDEEIAKTRGYSLRPEEHHARLQILQTEMELLHQELSLAQQRQQLVGRPKKIGSIRTSKKKKEEAQWLIELQQHSVSQLGQDLWALKETAYKRNGFFVEFGAMDGVLLSNTYLLEREFSWSGLCAEPNPHFFVQLKANRRCVVSNDCIGGRTGEDAEFIFANAYGGFAKYANTDNHAKRRAAYAVAGKLARLTTISLNDFLKKYDAPHEIDYISIDTEGSEFEILSAFPFDAWNVKLITVEHNFTPQRQLIRRLLQRNGYQCLEQQWEDWYINVKHLQSRNS